MAGQCRGCRGVREQERCIKWGKGRRDGEIRKLRRGRSKAKRNRSWEREGRTRIRKGRRYKD